MVTDAEVVPFNTYSFVDVSNGIKEGRGALYNWKTLGYLVSLHTNHDPSSECALTSRLTPIGSRS